MILHEVEGLACVIYLACTNTRLMILSEKRLRDLMHIPSWEGDRIICLESWTADENLPEGVISQEYLDFIGGLSKEEEEKVGWTFGRWAMANFDSVPIQFEYLEWVGLQGRNGLIRKITWEDRQNSKDVKNDFKIVEELINHVTNVEDRLFVPNMEVLWNHTKQIYVRLSTALDELEDLEVTVHDDYNLMGKLLYIHISWLSEFVDPSTNEAHRRGLWAGDRFEFTVRSVLDSRLKKEEGKWKDVSEDAIKVLAKAYKKDHGKDWRKVLSRWQPEIVNYRRVRPAYHKATRSRLEGRT